MSKATVLVFGVSGQLALSLKAMPFASNARFVGSNEVDFTKIDSVEQALTRYCPKLIINTSAYTHVDDAEIEREKCQLVNAAAPHHIGMWARKNCASVIHFSTDSVFSGIGEKPWKEEDETGPLNWYGQTKLAGERLLLESQCHAAVFRVSWLFSEYRTNFLTKILSLAETRESIEVVTDQFGNPTYAHDVAKFLQRVIPKIQSQQIGGIYHLTNEGSTSRHGFAEYLVSRASQMGLRPRVKFIEGVLSSAHPTLAKRPPNAVLNIELTKSVFDEQLPTWRDAVDRCLSKMRINFEYC